MSITAGEISSAAEQFLSALPSINKKWQCLSWQTKADAGSFHNIFREDDDFEGGAYWFFRPNDSVVFDIGKSDISVWKRISQQAGKAVYSGEMPSSPPHTGRGWGFPNSTHLKWNLDKTSAETQACIRDGTFRVGWVAIEDPFGYCATLLEVYLQTFCRLEKGAVPELTYRIG